MAPPIPSQSPAPTPTSVSVSGGTGNYTSSGIPPASGVQGIAGDFSGPHMIERQTMTVSYQRIPNINPSNFIDSDISLSAVFPVYNPVSGNVQSTILAYRVESNVTVLKSYDRFDTSSFQQPQRFKVYATSADSNNATYGAVPQGGRGPAGSIETDQEFYNRRPWNSNDAEINQTMDGYNYYSEPSGTTATQGNQEQMWGQTTILANLEYMNMGMWYDTLHTRMTGYYESLYGPYKSSNDLAASVPAWLTTLGNQARTGSYLFHIDRATDGSDAGTNAYYAQRGGLSVSSTYHCPDYDPGRHDYT